MALINLQNISLSFGEPTLLDDISFQIHEGEKICLLLARLFTRPANFLVFKGKDTGRGCESCDLKTKAGHCSFQAKEILKDD